MALYSSQQEVFNQAIRGLAAQNWQRSEMTPEEKYSVFHCRYRQNQEASCPIRCAVGHLIPDDKYEPYWDMDNMGVGDILLDLVEKEIVSEEMAYDHPFFQRLQDAHDSTPIDCYSVEEEAKWMIKNLKDVAHEFNLAWPGDVPDRV